MKKVIVSIILVGMLLSTLPINTVGEEAIIEEQIIDESLSQDLSSSFEYLENDIFNDEFERCTFPLVDKPEYVPSEMIIKLSITEGREIQISTSPDGILATGVESIDKLNRKYGVFSAKQVFKGCSDPSLSNVYTFALDASADIPAIVAEYNKDPYVVYAEPNYIYVISKAQAKLPGVFPNDPYFSQQWALHQSNDCDIDAPEAWDIETGSSDVVIAVIDTGVDYNHEDLADNIWINDDEIPGNGIDDDNNGYIDDVRGWDFCNNDSNPMDDHAHGTHCAGIAGAVTDNGVGIAGVSWNCKIMALKFLDNTGSGSETDAAEAIIYAADNGADVISMSFGGGHSAVFEEAADIVYSQGVILIAAAGNFNSDNRFYPAAYDTVIAVAATDWLDYKAGFSNYGDWVEVAAPGVNILSTVLNNGYEKHDGTSMACPHVAGLAGLILSKDDSLSPDQVRNIIYYSADRLLPIKNIARGRINAHEALLRGPGPATALIDSPSHGADVKETIDIYGTALGKGFQYFTVEYGMGMRPSSGSWVEISMSTTPIQDNILASLNTGILDEGLYNLRLTVVCNNGTYGDTIWVVVNNLVNTIYVDDGGGPEIDFTSIQVAGCGAGSGDTVFVYNGTYYERLVIWKTINLTGETQENTIIDRWGYGYTVQISADGVRVSNFKIEGGGWMAGGLITYSSGNNITSNTFYSQQHGGPDITLQGPSSNNIISNNDFESTATPSIKVKYSCDNIIIGNTFEGGISLYAASNNVVTGNTLKEEGIELISCGDIGCSNNVISGNTIINVTPQAIELIEASENIVTNNTIISTTIGIRLCHCNNVIISENCITPLYWGAGDGIQIECSHNNTISENTIMDFKKAIRFFPGDYDNSTNNLIYHNNFIGSQERIYTTNYVNTFYNPDIAEGNYWSDYIGSDSDGDGIGDTPYIIPPHLLYNNDIYPLMNPVGDCWVTPDSHVCGDWGNEERAYDDHPYSTWAVYKKLGANDWSDWLTLTLDDSITIKGFRIRALEIVFCFDMMEVKFYNDDIFVETRKTSFTQWTRTYKPSEVKWFTVYFDGNEYEIDEVRIRFHEDDPFFGFWTHRARVYEFDFWKAGDCGGNGGDNSGGENYYNSCFLAGTKITMADGSYKNIEDIVVGDMVKSCDMSSSKLVPARVTKVYHHTPEEMAGCHLVINNDIRVTPNHLLYINGMLIEAGDIEEGDLLTNSDGSETEITSIQQVFEHAPTYDFEVSSDGGLSSSSMYIVEGILAHKNNSQPSSPTSTTSSSTSQTL